MCKRLIQFLLFTALVTALFPTQATNTPTGILSLSPTPAPSLQIQDMDGEAFDLSQHKGSWVFVHFWASWCGPCRKEMPAIAKMWHKLESQGLKIALVNTAENEDTVFAFLATYAPEIRALMDKDGQATEKWQPRGLPATFLVDPKGQLRFQALGGRPWDTAPYLAFLQQLLQQNHVR